MILIRPASGRKRGGMLSHVTRPITTAFFLLSLSPSSRVSPPVVTRAKYFNSRGKRHGNLPRCPIPLFIVAATMSVTRLIDKKDNALCVSSRFPLDQGTVFGKEGKGPRVFWALNASRHLPYNCSQPSLDMVPWQPVKTKNRVVHIHTRSSKPANQMMSIN
jgi:hypothetical protein